MDTDSRIVYRVNDQDEITFTNQEWSRFAARNDGAALDPQKIVGRPLWDFIADETARHLYREILRQVRLGSVALFNFRCDSAECRRFLEMSISKQENGDVQFETRCLSVESRRLQRILEWDTPRSEQIVNMCAWCNRINVAEDKWEEVEAAIVSLRLFEQTRLPSISHGMCSDCYQRICASAIKNKSAAF